MNTALVSMTFVKENTIGPCTHWQFYPTRVPFANGRYTETTSGGVRSGRERFASGWRCSVNARVDASAASGTAATRRLRMSAD